MIFAYLFKRIIIRIARISCYELCALIALTNTVIIIWNLLSSESTNEQFYQDVTTKKNVLKKHLTLSGNTTRNPIIIKWTEDRHTKQVTVCEPGCDVYSGYVVLPQNTRGAYLFNGDHITWYDLPLPRNKDHIWALYHDKPPTETLELFHEKALNLFNFSSTFSRYSDVPFPLQSITSLENITSRRYFVDTQIKNLLLSHIAPILYLQSNCDTSTDRDRYIKTLKLFQRVDSYGRCLNNKGLPYGLKNFDQDYWRYLDSEDFLKFVARYKFVIAIESDVCDDYISEKFWRAIHVGVVPIYFGSPSIKYWLPNERSAIILNDFPTPKSLSNHIDELMYNNTLYEGYLEHKTEGKIGNKRLVKELEARPYQTSRKETRKTFICFLCKKLREKENKVHVVGRRHYDCPKPVSVFSRKSEASNLWVSSWEYAKTYADSLYSTVMKT